MKRAPNGKTPGTRKKAPWLQFSKRRAHKVLSDERVLTVLRGPDYDLSSTMAQADPREQALAILKSSVTARVRSAVSLARRQCGVRAWRWGDVNTTPLEEAERAALHQAFALLTPQPEFRHYLDHARYAIDALPDVFGTSGDDV